MVEKKVKKFQQEIVAKVSTKKPTKISTHFYLDKQLTERFKKWCKEHQPPLKPAVVMEELLRNFLDDTE